MLHPSFLHFFGRKNCKLTRYDLGFSYDIIGPDIFFKDYKFFGKKKCFLSVILLIYCWISKNMSHMTHMAISIY